MPINERNSKMEFEQNDVNNTAAVMPSGVVEAAPTVQQDVVNAAPAAQANQIAAADVQQGVSQPAAGMNQVQQPANQQVQQTVQGAAVIDPLMQQQQPAQAQQLPGPVPYDRFKEVNDAKNAMATKIEQMEQTAQLQQMISANQQQPAQQAQFNQQRQQMQNSPSMQAIRALGFQDEAFLSPEQQAQVMDYTQQQVDAVTEQRTQMQSFVTSKPDFAQVVGEKDPFTGGFKYAEPMQRLILSNPAIQNALGSMQPLAAAAMAYEMASKDSTYMASLTQQPVLQQLPGQLPANVQQNVQPIGQQMPVQQQFGVQPQPVQQMPGIQPVGVQQPNQAAVQMIDAANNLASISAVQAQGAIDKAAQIRAMDNQTFTQYAQGIMSQAT